MADATVTIETLRRVSRELLANRTPGPFVVFAHPTVERDVRYIASGRPRIAHRRAAGARGRKRVLMTSWRPVNG